MQTNRRLEVKLTFERAHEFFSYDSSNGNLIRKIATSNSTKAGEVAGTVSKSLGYVCVKVDGEIHYAHRVIWLMSTGSLPDLKIDHINGDRKDNRMCNLRQVTDSENSQNMRAARKNKAGLLGAHWVSATNNWRSNITVNGIAKHLGMFGTAQEAHNAYLKAKRELHLACSI